MLRGQEELVVFAAVGPGKLQGGSAETLDNEDLLINKSSVPEGLQWAALTS